MTKTAARCPWEQRRHRGLANWSVFVVGTDHRIAYRWYTDDASSYPTSMR